MYWLSLMVCGMMFITFSRLLVFGCYFVAAVLVWRLPITVLLVLLLVLLC